MRGSRGCVRTRRRGSAGGTTDGSPAARGGRGRRGRSGRSGSGSPNSSTRGRAGRVRVGAPRLVVRRSPRAALSPVAAGLRRGGRSDVRRRGRGGSASASAATDLRLAGLRSTKPENFAVMAATNPAAPAFSAVLRPADFCDVSFEPRVDSPKYQRARPISKTAADVNNISGKRSISGYPQLIARSFKPPNWPPWNRK